MATASRQRPSNTDTVALTELVTEYASIQTQKLRVDRDKAVIHRVKILGLESKNGRSYKPSALRIAASMYDGAKVNTDHPQRKDMTRDRLVGERMGNMRNVVFQEGEGLYADFHYNPKHRLAEQVIWEAENSPENLGFSPQHGIKGLRVGGKVVVESITSVRSVDLVADPATTNGLFESLEPTRDVAMTLENTVESTRLSPELITLDLLESRSDLKTAIIREHQETEEARKAAKEFATLRDQKSVFESTADELKALREYKDTAEAEKAVAKKRELVSEAVDKSGLDRRDKKIVSDFFVEGLLKLEEAEVVKAIEDRKSLVKGMATGKPRSKPQDVTEGLDIYEPADPKSVASKYRAD